MGVAPLTITPGDPLANILFPLPTTLWSAGLDSFVPEGGVLPPGDARMMPLKQKLRLSCGHFGLLMTESPGQKGVTVLAGAMDPDSQGEIAWLRHRGGKEECFQCTGQPLGCPLVLPRPVIKAHEKL